MIPSYVKNKSSEVQDKWKSIVSSCSNENIGLVVANKWLSKQKEEIVMRDFTFVTDEEQVVFRSIGGNEYVDFLLTDTGIDGYGTRHANELLIGINKLINSGKVSLKGDFNHDFLRQLQESGNSKEAIKKKMLSLKQGVAKVIKAIYDNGKLYLRALVNPRYKKRIMKSKGVSIEGSFIRKGNTFVSGTILGFSFIDADNKKLGNPRSKILR